MNFAISRFAAQEKESREAAAGAKLDELWYVSRKTFRTAMARCHKAVDALRQHMDGVKGELATKVERCRKDTLARVEAAEDTLARGIEHVRQAEADAVEERAALRTDVAGVREVADTNAQRLLDNARELAAVKEMVRTANNAVYQVWHQVQKAVRLLPPTDSDETNTAAVTMAPAVAHSTSPRAQSAARAKRAPPPANTTGPDAAGYAVFLEEMRRFQEAVR